MIDSLSPVAFDDLPSLQGRTVYVSEWTTVDREHLQMFAQSCYLAPENVDMRFSQNNALGADLVDGFLRLSMRVVWNFKRVRWITPVMLGDPLRAECAVREIKRRGEGWLGTLDVRVHKQGSERPAMTAEWLCLFLEGDYVP